MKKPDEISREIKDLVNRFLHDKSITRPVLIEAFEDVAADIEGVIDALKDDERRASQGGGK